MISDLATYCHLYGKMTVKNSESCNIDIRFVKRFIRLYVNYFLETKLIEGKMEEDVEIIVKGVKG